MNKENYQKQLDTLIACFEQENRVPTLLLHSCCAPCSSYVIEYLSSYFHITVFYYNPNIYPETEYRKRVEEQKRLLSEMPVKYPVQFIEGEFDTDTFYKLTKGLEHEPECGARCEVCYRLRLTRTAELAHQLGFDYFTTTLTISPLKDAAKINLIGQSVAQSLNISFLPSDFKKRNGYKRSIELSSQYHLYRQNYCGCVFSKNQREEDKY